jgi:hypothetical protein
MLLPESGSAVLIEELPRARFRPLSSRGPGQFLRRGSFSKFRRRRHPFGQIRLESVAKSWPLFARERSLLAIVMNLTQVVGFVFGGDGGMFERCEVRELVGAWGQGIAEQNVREQSVAERALLFCDTGRCVTCPVTDGEYFLRR